MLKNIYILSIFDVLTKIQTDSLKDFDIISIRDSMQNNLYKLLNKELEKNTQCKSYLIQIFDDIEEAEINKQEVSYKNITDMLDFSKDKKNLIVHCNMGVSRSSATAYLIKYFHTKDINEALKLLDFKKHNPNELLIRRGSKILKNPEIYTEFLEYRKNEMLKLNDYAWRYT